MIDANAYIHFMSARRAELLERVAQAASRTGRSAEEIDVIAVSKTVGHDELVCAVQAGWRTFGENRPQELAKKISDADTDPTTQGLRFDMIGNLQTNKINQVLRCTLARKTDFLIHSISSLHLAEATSKRAEVLSLGRPRCLIEVNVSGEASKSGFSSQELKNSFEALLKLEGLSIEGLMTMAPYGDKHEARRTFSGLRKLRDELEESFGCVLPVLSAGMSDDFEIAVEEGSTLVRLGRCVFDPQYGIQ